MKFMICPTCGAKLANKQLVMEAKLIEVCNNLGLNFDLISSGVADSDEKFIKERTKIVNEICKRYCCKEHLVTCCEIVDIIRG